MTLMLVRYSESRDFAVQIRTRDSSVTNQRTHIVATLPLPIEGHLGPVREAAVEGRMCFEHEAWRPSTWRVVEEREIAGAPTVVQVPARSRRFSNRTHGKNTIDPIVLSP